MSVFMEMLVELLPLGSALQKEDNELRKVLDRSVGEFWIRWSCLLMNCFLLVLRVVGWMLTVKTTEFQDD